MVNSGFKTGEPVALPLKLAKKLGLKPQEAEEFTGAGRVPVPIYPLRGVVEVCVVTEERRSEVVRTAPLMIPGEEEVLLSDGFSARGSGTTRSSGKALRSRFGHRDPHPKHLFEKARNCQTPRNLLWRTDL